MTTYTTISSGSLAVGKPLTSTIAIALRDNPLAIAEGDASAPKIQFAALDAWYITAGAVGTYCFAVGTVDKAFGTTVAGSTLTPTSAACGTSNGTNGNGAMDVGAALSGSWRCMGTYDYNMSTSGTINWTGATLWLRIA